MAETYLRSAHERSNRTSYPTAEHPIEIDPSDYPDTYASILKGACLEPEFFDGDCLVFSKTEAYQAGDLVGFWLHPDLASREASPRFVKRLALGLPPGFALPFRSSPASECMPLVMLEQSNPPRRYRLPATDVVAIHKAIGTAVVNGDGTARVVLFASELSK